MSALAQEVVSTVGSAGSIGQRLEHEAVVALATADDVASGAAAVAALLRHAAAARRVEWWAPGDDGEPECVGASGVGQGPRQEIPIGRGGAFVVFGGCLDLRLAPTLAPLMAILRRRRSEELLARKTVELARRNEALEDYAALVAHELKTPLLAALTSSDPSGSVGQALDLVDALLAAARTDVDVPAASAAGSLHEAVRDLRAAGVEVTADLDATLPLPAGQLRVVLRNLLENAAAAGAQHVHVTAERSSGALQLHVDDDGAGLGATDRYTSGSGIGLSLCRRIAARFGGALELSARPRGGTRATLAFAETFR